MNLETLVIRINKSLQSLTKHSHRSMAVIHACNLFKTTAISSQAPVYFGTFLHSCPFRFLKKMRFYCDVEQTVNGKYFVNRVSVSVRWKEDFEHLEHKAKMLNELFEKLDYTKLSISSNVEDTFNFDNLRKITF
jgi:hypothetical protein